MSDDLQVSRESEVPPWEVSLLEDVIACRSCGWFWRDNPYGPYPAFDFEEDFPGRFLTAGNGDAANAFSGQLAGQSMILPQVLHGCRKAPIMTIGINPNLTGFRPGTAGASWAYPLFSDLRRSAYYYRYRTVHQESLPLDVIARHLKTDGAVLAEASGRLVGARRPMTDREVTLTIAYDDPDLGTKEIARNWDVENHLVILFDPVGNDGLEGPAQFAAGDVIAGIIDIPNGPEGTILKNRVGYYQRFVPILERLSGFLRAEGHDPDLRLGEDVCQLDMVGCASPGWGSAYDIDKDEVVGNCVRNHAWALKQLLQTNPRMIVFSGRSAFQMFADVFGGAIQPELPEIGETYGLLAETCRRPYYLTIESGAMDPPFRLRARRG